MSQYVLCHPWIHFPMREVFHENWQINTISGDRAGAIVHDSDDKGYHFNIYGKSSCTSGVCDTLDKAKAMVESSLNIKIVEGKLNPLI